MLETLDIRDLFAVEGFQPDTWQRREDTVEVSGTLRCSDGRTFKALMVAHPTGEGTLTFGTGWVRPPPPVGAEEAYRQAIADVLRLMRGREADLRLRLFRRPRRVAAVHWHFSTKDIEGPLPSPLVEAASNPATREIRLGLSLRSACVQNCRFCPPKAGTTAGPEQWESDLAFVRRLAEGVFWPARRLDIPVTVTLLADDLLGHGRLEDILRVLHEEVGCPVHLVTPVNRIRDKSDAQWVARLPGVESLACTLFGASARVHDEVAGRPGAFRETVRALGWLSRLQTLALRVRMVVTRQGLADLPAVMDTASALGASFTVAGLVADSPEHLRLLAGLMPRVDAVRRVLQARTPAILAATRAGSPVEIVDLPLCALPVPLRTLARSRRPRDRPLVGYEWPDVCLRCRGRDECLGLPRPYWDDFGEEGLEPY